MSNSAGCYDSPQMARQSAHHLDSTLIEAPENADTKKSDDPFVPVLVLLWSRDEPERIGEMVCLQPHEPNQVYTVGRAITAGSDGSMPLSFGQLRPTGRCDTGPLRAAHVSRRQIRIRSLGDGKLQVEQGGRGKLRLNGHILAQGLIEPGYLIELEHRLTLLYSRRPIAWSREQVESANFTYGEADRFGIVGESPAAWKLRQRATFLAKRDEHVLILGPSGSGKELLVQAIHGQSRRAKKPLVSRNAATIPEALIDAELFGNLRNYPNPGMPERLGLLGAADGSSLFLDEIGELPPKLQAHLLRVMDCGEYQRLGEPTVKTADLRIIAATNRDPGDLKHDFLARFPHRLTLPGLRQRPEDVLLIARHLLREIAAKDPETIAHVLHDGEPQLSAEFAALLSSYAFTTHVRELSELLWRSLHAAKGPNVGPPSNLFAVARSRPMNMPAAAVRPTSALSRAQVEAALASCGGVKEAAWRQLGLRNRYQLHRLLKKLGIE